MKKILFIFLLLLIPLIGFAQENPYSTKKLEITYPQITTGGTAPTETSTLPEYIKYLYYFAIGASGFLALVIIIVAGFQYVSSAGNPSKVSEAKSRIGAAITGLVILMCSWLILNTINPQLVVFRTPEELPSILPNMAPGVYLCKESVNIIGFWEMKNQQSNNTSQAVADQMNDILKKVADKCILLSSGGDLPENIQGVAKSLYLVPVKDMQQYGVILFENTGAKGKGHVYYGTGGNSDQSEAIQKPTSFAISTPPNSASPFMINNNPPSNYKVTFFEGINRNIGPDGAKMAKTECQISGRSTTCSNLPKNKDGKTEIGSVLMNGSLFVVFFKNNEQWSVDSDIDIVASPGSQNLNNHLMGFWKQNECVEKNPQTGDRTYPCAEKAIAISANFY